MRLPVKTRLVAMLSGVLFLSLSAAPAQALFHTWVIAEIYSNADGTVQFIEFHEQEGLDIQNLLSVGTLSSDSMVFPFLTNLPSFVTANKDFLVGTAAYAASPGAVAPDYVIPDQFFSVSGDTISFFPGPATTIDQISFAAGDVPTNGLLSLGVVRGPSEEAVLGSVAVNSPTNFAGESGTVVPSTPIVLLARLGADQAGGAGRTGSGSGIFTFDPVAETLALHIHFAGLSDEELAAHIHGPAVPGIGATVLYPLALGNPKLETLELVDLPSYTVAAQIQDLLNGLWYANVHSLPFPGGEIRGQMTALAYCADGFDNDLDGLVDFPDDPGCSSAASHRENTACNDGIDNDGDGLVDLDDPACLDRASSTSEAREGCGLGFELALFVLPLAKLQRRRRFAAACRGA